MRTKELNQHCDAFVFRVKLRICAWNFFFSMMKKRVCFVG
jgi:hypothetical protein